MDQVFFKLPNGFMIDQNQEFRFKDSFYRDSNLSTKNRKQYAIYGNDLYIYEDGANQPYG